MHEAKAKNKAQRKQILRRLERLWDNHPELSLPQILEACFHEDTPLDHCFYYATDAELLAAIEGLFDSQRIVN